MPYLVDGNNLAHVLGLSRGGTADREACGRVVAAFCRSQGAQATVIFDGPAPSGAPASQQMHRVRMEFSEGRSADDVILRLVALSRTPADLTVVTSDKSLGDRARHHGASLEKCHAFAKRLGRSQASPVAEPEKPARKETAEQINAWLAVFDPGRKQSAGPPPGSRRRLR